MTDDAWWVVVLSQTGVIKFANLPRRDLDTTVPTLQYFPIDLRHREAHLKSALKLIWRSQKKKLLREALAITDHREGIGIYFIFEICHCVIFKLHFIIFFLGCKKARIPPQVPGSLWTKTYSGKSFFSWLRSSTYEDSQKGTRPFSGLRKPPKPFWSLQ